MRILALKGIADIDAHYAGLPAGQALMVDKVAQVITALGCDPAWEYANDTVRRLVFDSGTGRPARASVLPLPLPRPLRQRSARQLD